MLASLGRDSQGTLLPDSSSQRSHAGPRSLPDASPASLIQSTTKSFQQPHLARDPSQSRPTQLFTANGMPAHPTGFNQNSALTIALPARDRSCYKQGNLHKNTGGSLNRNFSGQKRMKWHILRRKKKQNPFNHTYYIWQSCLLEMEELKKREMKEIQTFLKVEGINYHWL